MSQLKSLKAKSSPQQARRTVTDVILRVCLMYILVNIFAATIAKFFSLDRPLFNLDYLLAGLVYIWISRSIAALMLLGLIAVEFVRYWIPTYFFSKQAFSIIFWLRSASHWPPAVLVCVIAMTITTATILVFLFRRYKLSLREKLVATGTFIALGILVFSSDIANGSNSIWKRESNFFDCNICTSPLRLVGIQTWFTLSGKPAKFLPLYSDQSATTKYFSVIGALPDSTNRPSPPLISPDHLPEKIVVIIFESFSMMADDTNLERWLEPFATLKTRYTIETGSFDWVGATLRGEIRELCWMGLDGAQNLSAMSTNSMPAALPKVLNNLGYETKAFHGFYKAMYERDKVYPMLGFDHSVFLVDMQEQGNVPLAGTLFRGAQDSYVAGLVHDELRKPGKRFVYWMTLTSHFPVNVPFAKNIATPKELQAFEKLPPPVWAYQVICHKTLQSIAAIAADQSLTNCDFVIVGDHYLSTANAEKDFYIHNRVPYLILRHNAGTPTVAAKQ
jgi:hypothetical protein